MWQRIVGTEAGREYWRAIADIEQSLSEHLAREATGNALPEPNLAHGTAGVALFFAYLHAAGGSEEAADRTIEALALSREVIGARHVLPSLYSGFAGVGWVTAHLTRELFEGAGDLNLEIDDAIRRLLSEVTEKAPFEQLGGLAGYGSYLVERFPDAGAEELLDRVIGLLEASRESNGVWFTRPEWLVEWQRQLMPQGCFNVGVAHGVPGVIGFLAAAWSAGLRDRRIPRMANDAVRWLVAQRGTWPGSLYPSHVSPESGPRQTRTAWCYGDLGIAAVLLSAARAFGRPEWQDEALTIARAAAARTVEDTKVTDAGLCHGAAGIAHLFNRLYQATGDGQLRGSARRWYRLALDMRRPGEGAAGFLSWIETMRPGEGEWKGEAGFLSGVAGIGLALLSAVTDLEPAWDRVMVISVPPRNGAGAS